MTHVKKMVLIPHDSLARLNDKTPSTQREHMSSLDTEMSHILNKQYADDSEKWKHYSDTLQRYLHFAAEHRKPVALHVTDTDPKPIPPSPMRAHLASMVPRTYKDVALRIFDFISQEGSPVTVDPSGTVSINGNPQPQSNIVDLISDLTRARKSVGQPLGSQAFVRALASMNVPLELIGNEQRKHDIHRLKSLKPLSNPEDGENKKKKRRSRQPSPQTGLGFTPRKAPRKAIKKHAPLAPKKAIRKKGAAKKHHWCHW